MVKKEFENVYQFKIVLEEVNPRVWRRILVSENYSFWDLHVAIQDAMGWTDSHLHEFIVADPNTTLRTRIGIPSEDDFEPIKAGWENYLTDFFSNENKTAEYVYDFGDTWTHEIRLEKILPAEKNTCYPACIGGERACPPEDCGGAYGYADLLDIVKNPEHEEYKEKIEWLGKDFNPEHFDVKQIHFDDPKKRLKTVLSYR